MTTIKSHTDLEQSKKLAKILPLESADMYYILMPDGVYNHFPLTGRKTELAEDTDIPCWSLAALLDVLPVIDLYAPSLKMKLTHKYYIEFFLHEQKRYLTTDDYENPVDACYEMILKLHESKML